MKFRWTSNFWNLNFDKFCYFEKKEIPNERIWRRRSWRYFNIFRFWIMMKWDFNSNLNVSIFIRTCSNRFYTSAIPFSVQNNWNPFRVGVKTVIFPEKSIHSKKQFFVKMLTMKNKLVILPKMTSSNSKGSISCQNVVHSTQFWVKNV